jgi:hypothetical protein
MVQSVYPLLKDIIKDNPTFKFPVELIQKELMHIFLDPMEFDYFIIQSFKKLKRDYGSTMGHIFLTILENKIETKKRDISELEISIYQDLIESFIQTLERTYITRIEKDSSDGEMMSVMVE